MNNDILRKLVNVQLEISQLMAEEDAAELEYLARTDSKPSLAGAISANGPITNDTVGALIAAGADKQVDLSEVNNTPGAEALDNITNGNTEQAATEIKTQAANVVKKNPKLADKLMAIVNKVNEKVAKGPKGDWNKVAAALELKKNKNDAFKYGLSLIVVGGLFGAIMIPSMKSQLSEIVENGKPVMEKVFAALKLLSTAVAAFVPMSLGSMLLWFSFSDAAPDKDSMIDKIVMASVVFFRSVEEAIFGKAEIPNKFKPKAAQAPKETPKVETPKAGTDAGTNAYIQQRVAKLQLDLAQLSHDLY